MINEEIWKDVVGFEGVYMVSNLGRVKVLSRYVNCPRNGVPSLRKEKIMKNHITYQGYIGTPLTKNGQCRNYRTHRLVAYAFLEVPVNHSELHVNHKDCNRANNCVENLEWVTHSENVKHSYEQGSANQVGEKNNSAKITGETALEIKKLLKTAKSRTEIAEEVGVSLSIVKNIKSGIAWKHIKLEDNE